MDMFWVALGVLIVILALYTFRILREYERGVIFFLGRFQAVKGPGLIIVIPGIQVMVKVDLRTMVYDVPQQDVISRDNVSVSVSAVIYFRVIDAQKAIINVEDYYEATNQLAQTTLRSILGQHELDDMLAQRDKLNEGIQKLLDEQTEAWGIKVANVEIKHVDIDDTMIRAIAKQAEAERERRAKVIHATGEFEASRQLVEAANTLSQQPQALQLRYMQTLTDLGRDRSSVIVFPLPIDIISSLTAVTNQLTGGNANNDDDGEDNDQDKAPKIPERE
ncbi:MAG: slipin family protein [Pseudomonadales bacterium]